jgi:hypothetical protein
MAGGKADWKPCDTVQRGQSLHPFDTGAQKGRPVKQGLIRHLIAIAGISVEEFLELYK